MLRMYYMPNLLNLNERSLKYKGAKRAKKKRAQKMESEIGEKKLLNM